jgi:hypothetical protein
LLLNGSKVDKLRVSVPWFSKLVNPRIEKEDDGWLVVWEYRNKQLRAVRFQEQQVREVKRPPRPIPLLTQLFNDERTKDLDVHYTMQHSPIRTSRSVFALGLNSSVLSTLVFKNTNTVLVDVFKSRASLELAVGLAYYQYPKNLSIKVLLETYKTGLELQSQPMMDFAQYELMSKPKPWRALHEFCLSIEHYPIMARLVSALLNDGTAEEWWLLREKNEQVFEFCVRFVRLFQ